MSKIQNQALKNSTEAGAVLRLVPDTKVYITANSINKTLDDAITGGDIGSGGAPSVVTQNSSATYDMTSESPGTVIYHRYGPGTVYTLPTAAAGKYFTFICDTALDGTIASKMQIKAATGDIILWNNQTCDNPGYLEVTKRGVVVSVTAIDATYWVVDRVVATDHVKNTTIGLEKGVAIVGRDTWISKATFTGSQSVVGAAATLNSYVYVFKGSDNNTPTTPTTQNIQYNDTTNAWSTKSTFAFARALTAQADAFNGYAYHGGGSASGAAHTDMERYNDFANSTTTRGTTSNQHTDANAATLNGYYYYFTARQSGFPQERYNDGTNTWSSIATTGASQWYTQAFELSGYVYLPGGVIGFGGSDQRSYTYQYNDSANTFIQKSNMTYSAGYGSGASINGRGFSVGGSDGPLTTRYSSLSVYNDSLNTWTSGANSGYSRNRSSGAAASGYFYVAAGNTSGGNVTHTEQYN